MCVSVVVGVEQQEYGLLVGFQPVKINQPHPVPAVSQLFSGCLGARKNRHLRFVGGRFLWDEAHEEDNVSQRVSVYQCCR